MKGSIGFTAPAVIYRLDTNQRHRQLNPAHLCTYSKVLLVRYKVNSRRTLSRMRTLFERNPRGFIPGYE